MRHLFWIALGFGAGAYLTHLRRACVPGGPGPTPTALEDVGAGIFRGLALGTGFILANRLADGFSEKKK